MGRTLKSLLAALAAALLLPAVAGASVTLTPTTYDFGNVALGSSTTHSFRLAAICDDDPAEAGYQCPPVTEPAVPVAISISGGFTQTNNCPSSLPRDEPARLSYCDIRVTYAPLFQGWATGVLSTGDGAPSSTLAANGVKPVVKAKKKKRCRKAKRERGKCLKRKRSR